MPSTIVDRSPDSGIKGALEGLLKTGIEFFTENVFGGQEADKLERQRVVQAQMVAQQTARPAAASGQGTGFMPGILALAAVGIVAFVITR